MTGTNLRNRRRTYLKLVNEEQQKLSKSSSKRNQLHPEQAWGSLCTGREVCLLEMRSSSPGKLAKGSNLLSTYGASLPEAASPHSKMKPEARTVP